MKLEEFDKLTETPKQLSDFLKQLYWYENKMRELRKDAKNITNISEPERK